MRFAGIRRVSQATQITRPARALGAGALDGPPGGAWWTPGPSLRRHRDPLRTGRAGSEAPWSTRSHTPKSDALSPGLLTGRAGRGWGTRVQVLGGDLRRVLSRAVRRTAKDSVARGGRSSTRGCIPEELRQRHRVSRPQPGAGSWRSLTNPKAVTLTSPAACACTVAVNQPVGPRTSLPLSLPIRRILRSSRRTTQDSHARSA